MGDQLFSSLPGIKPRKYKPCFPNVVSARRLAEEGYLDGILIVGFGDGKFSVTTYGATKRQCAALKKVNDFIADAIESGKVGL